jgi:hypothetical protein
MALQTPGDFSNRSDRSRILSQFHCIFPSRKAKQHAKIKLQASDAENQREGQSKLILPGHSAFPELGAEIQVLFSTIRIDGRNSLIVYNKS